MTTNKPEPVAYGIQIDAGGSLDRVYLHRDEAERYFYEEEIIGLVRLSDYEALQAECEKLRATLDRYRTSKPALLLFSKVPRYRINQEQTEDGWGRSTGCIRVSEEPTGEFMLTEDVRRIIVKPLHETTK